MSSTAFRKKANKSHNLPTTAVPIDISQPTINELKQLISDKLFRIRTILQKTLRALNSYRSLGIISNSDVIVCTNTLIDCQEKISQLSLAIQTNANISGGQSSETSIQTVDNFHQMIDQLQHIIDKLSIIMCGYGTQSIEDILFISFGSDLDLDTIENTLWRNKCELILKNVRPIGYKTIHWKQLRTKPKFNMGELSANSTLPLCINKQTEETIPIELSNQYECFDIDFANKTNYVKIYGTRVVIHNDKTQKTIIIQGVVDDIPLECVENAYIQHRKQSIISFMPNSDTFDVELMHRIIGTLTIKDILVCGNDDIYKRHIAIMTEVNYIKYNKLNTTIKRFLDMDSFHQRAMLIHLLIYNREDEVQYITYLLYDLISVKPSGTQIDSVEQQLLYDSFPWRIKLYFKDTMKNTIKYTKDMISKYDINRISLEQQIYVMKVPENVREKAMAKLKEVKGKTDDSGTKAKQYLEGLLKIPFGVYREEPCLKKTKVMNAQFLYAIDKADPAWGTVPRSIGKSHYTAFEIGQMCRTFNSKLRGLVYPVINDQLSVKQLNSICKWIADTTPGAILDKESAWKKTQPKSDKLQWATRFIRECSDDTLAHIYDIAVYDAVFSPIAATPSNSPTSAAASAAAASYSLWKTHQELSRTYALSKELNPDLENITSVLDNSIYGHEHAKSQILKIISQWMNGEQSGYCFGFEGSPGIGKTSLAKRGLAYCLKDEQGESRPFSFIALGGSCNGSTLEGHSYTYVNSMWGRIADVLMDSKCMNPIIYIDELDKVSKTEHGKEIIGILMHLIDPTQNAGFQDKYFSGIDIDLSKALFIFSYNDPAQIDSILLDRIHRIRFDNLSLEDKIVIVRKYIIPEITKKMGLEQCVELTDEVITYIIETYTLESGVRKLKEVMFDLYGEINLKLMRCDPADDNIEFPIKITVHDLDTHYLTKYDKILEKVIHSDHEIGVINGLWANALGRGGIIPIQTMFFPSSSFLDLKLTGMQGDVMKESMTVAKSLAWNLLTDGERDKCLARFEKTKEQGLHIHCPDGAVSKDGPSAGAAITVAIYSLFSGKKIRSDVAMTGEINLQGKITEIGGLDHKIAGGIRAGVVKFLYPVANQRDLDKYLKKMGEGHTLLEGVEFVAVSHIQDTFAHLLVDE